MTIGETGVRRPHGSARVQFVESVEQTPEFGFVTGFGQQARSVVDELGRQPPR